MRGLQTPDHQCLGMDSPSHQCRRHTRLRALERWGSNANSSASSEAGCGCHLGTAGIYSVQLSGLECILSQLTPLYSSLKITCGLWFPGSKHKTNIFFNMSIQQKSTVSFASIIWSFCRYHTYSQDTNM